MNSMKVRLTKIHRDPNLEGGLRTPIVEGDTECLPKVGSSFRMFGAPLEGGICRMVITNLVSEVTFVEDGKYRFETESGSIYQVETI